MKKARTLSICRALCPFSMDIIAHTLHWVVSYISVSSSLIKPKSSHCSLKELDSTQKAGKGRTAHHLVISNLLTVSTRSTIRGPRGRGRIYVHVSTQYESWNCVTYPISQPPQAPADVPQSAACEHLEMPDGTFSFTPDYQVLRLNNLPCQLGALPFRRSQYHCQMLAVYLHPLSCVIRTFIVVRSGL
jgi:hypothetical protein